MADRERPASESSHFVDVDYCPTRMVYTACAAFDWRYQFQYSFGMNQIQRLYYRDAGCKKSLQMKQANLVGQLKL